MDSTDPNNPRERKDDGALFREQMNVTANNANLFLSNNSNPFLISPFTPIGNLAFKFNTLTDVSAQVSSIAGNLSTVFDFETETLYICTIQPLRSDPSQVLHIYGSTIDIAGAPGSVLNVYSSSFFNYISTKNLQANTVIIGTIVTNTVSTNQISSNTITTSTMNASTISTNSISVQSTLYASTINTTSLNYSIMTGSTITASTLTVHSTLNASTINYRALTGSTLIASSIFSNNVVSSPLFNLVR